MLARCPNHPEVPALGNCQRCGTFFCADDRLDVDGVAYCKPCGVRPDVDWLEAYRKSLLGKRDSWAWLFGFSAIGYLILAVALVVNTNGDIRDFAFPAVFSAVAGVLFFLGKPVARLLLVLSVVFWGLIEVVFYGPWLLVPTAISALIVGTALLSTRNRLFFKLEVPRKKLTRDYELLADNRLARNALALGAFSLLIPIFGPLAIVCGAIAFRRVDPKARPPIGKGAHAIAGIVFGVLGLGVAALWVTIFLNVRH